MSKPDTSPNAEALRQQLMTANINLERERSANASLQAWISAHLDGRPPSDDEALLHDLALALISSTEMGRPAPPSQTVDGQAIHRPKPGSRPPSGGNPRARLEHRKLHDAVRGAINRYGIALERGFDPPTDEERETLRLSRRCHGDQCIGVLGRGHKRSDHKDDDGYSIGKCWGRGCLGVLRPGHAVREHEAEQPDREDLVPVVPEDEPPGQTKETP